MKLSRGTGRPDPVRRFFAHLRPALENQKGYVLFVFFQRVCGMRLERLLEKMVGVRYGFLEQAFQTPAAHTPEKSKKHNVKFACKGLARSG